MNATRLSRLIVITIAPFFFWGLSETAAQERKKPVIPVPVDLLLKTSDGVNLQCTYFEPVDLNPKGPAVAQQAEGDLAEWGHSVIPWILIHDWDGTRQDLFAFAEELQKRGSNAVIVPDLRGHGGSTVADGLSEKLDRSKFRRPELQAMVNDIERCKKFLVQENNAGKLNIDLLNLVCIGEMAAITMAWTIQDWYAFPPFAGNIKQAQDVKTIVLVSPKRKFSSLNINDELKHAMFSGRNPRIPNLPTLIAWGELDDSSQKDGAYILETMRRGRPDVSRVEDDQLRRELTTLYSKPIQSNASGTELMRTNLDLRDTIVRFVATKVGANRENHPWQNRTRN
jgi:hypothetical protein